MVWLVCQMSGFAAGGALPKSAKSISTVIPTTWVPHLVRLTAVMPALVGSGTGLGTVLLWSGVVVGNTVAGAAEATERSARREAVAAERWSAAVPSLGTGRAVVRVTGWARPGTNDRWSVPARVLVWADDDTGSSDGVRPQPGEGLYLSGKREPPPIGAVVSGPMEVRIPPVAALPGAFDYRQFLAGRGLRWQARLHQHQVCAADDPASWVGAMVLQPIRRGVIEKLSRLLPAREAQLAGAVLLGVRTADSKAISGPFSALGLAHLFAVSGLHVGILLGIILLPGRLIGLSPRAATGPLWLFMPLYLLLTGLPGSVVRAGGMGLLAGQARWLGRRVDSLRILGLLYWGGSLLDPLQNLDTGLRLSYLAAGGILLVSRATNGFKLTGHRLFKPVLMGLAVSFAAQWFTLPVVAASFGQISLLSPLANLIAVPLFGVAVWMLVLSLAASAIWLPLGQDLGAGAWLLLRSINGAVAWVTGSTGGLPWGLAVPGWAQIGGWLVLSLVFFWLLWLRPVLKRTTVLHLGAWFVLPVLLLQLTGPVGRTLPADDAVIVWQFDVGQGDCALLVFPDGWTALIDTGGRYGYQAPPAYGPLGRTILPFLRREGISRIDAVLLTHGHLDHTGGAQALNASVEVGRWYVAGRADRSLGGEIDSTLIVRPVTGEVLHRWGNWNLRIHYPLPDQEHAESENNWSLVAALSHNDMVEMVWSGDLELAGEAALLANNPGLAHTRVWKAGHHGSSTSGSEAFLNLLRPQLILISCGVGNSYGHPSHGPYVLRTAAGRDTVAVLRTDLEGSLRLAWGVEVGFCWQIADSQGEMARSP